MIYTCDKCRFIFSRVGEVDACPDCGKPLVREATPEEKEKYKKYQAVSIEEERMRGIKNG